MCRDERNARGAVWSGYNPAPGVFNHTYIDVIKQTVQLLNDQGIYVLLDMHQDIISSKFCLYDGAPRWVIDKSKPTHEYPFPLAPSGMQGDNCTRTGSPNSPCNCSAWPWSENALTVAAATAYQDIYDNKHGMLDDLTHFWVEAAKEFKDIPGIIGYEIMNEPFAGNIFEQPDLVLSGVAGRRNLQRMHDAVATKVREVDTQHIIFYEPVTWGMIFDGDLSGSGFEHVPGGDVWKNASAYAYHYYCMSWLPGWETQPVQRKLLCDAAIAPSVFRAVGKDIDRIGGAAMMTEGLACNQDNETQQQECIAVQNDLDSHLFSWTDYGDSQGEAWDVHSVQQRLWARTYARAVAGTPINMTFDIMNPAKPFEFCFLVDRRIQAPTEVWTSSRFHYPRGVAVTHSPNLHVQEDETRDGVYLLTPKTLDGARGEVGCVQMTAKLQ